MRIKQLLFQNAQEEKKYTLHGWLRTLRLQKSIAFLQINDGSNLSGIQVVANPEDPELFKILETLSTGCSLEIKGFLRQSPGQRQSLEFVAETITLLGSCDPESYPMQKKRHSLEFLRTLGHLRPRTNTIGAVSRLRHAMSLAIHRYFDEKGFLYVHTPIITASDCEGAGQMFAVTTLQEDQWKMKPVPYEEDFFGRQAFLTVSGQLNGEIYASALGDIYTFGPTFRAENSNTARHLAEFWMVEPELAFADLQDNISCAHGLLKTCVGTALEKCQEDMAFFDQFIKKGSIEALEQFMKSSLCVITYTEAIKLLKQASRPFQFPVEWGLDLQSEHERYLCEEYFKGPVVVTDYPKDIKSFYMRQNEDGKTVAAMDVLVPQIGEIIGGSQREERFDILLNRMKEMKLDPEEYSFYLDLRRYGTVVHSGFGLGFERLILWISGLDNIRDAIPFPRYPKHADF